MNARIIAGLVGLGLLIAAVVFGPALLSSLFSAKQEARTAKGQGEAAVDSGALATNTVADVLTNDTATEKVVQGGRDEIRKAPEADRGAVTVAAACRLLAYRDSERCAALRGSGAPGVDPAR